MRFHIITIFPRMLEGYLSESIISRAIKNKLIEVHTYALREFTLDKHGRVDGKPYGGGPGMVMWVDPIIRAVEKINKNISKRKNTKIKTVIFNPAGKNFTNILAKDSASKYTDIILICGRYEGIDARVKKILKAEEWNIGPYVITGGELPALIVVDAIARQLKGVLHAEDSVEENRIASHEMYGRPEAYVYKGKKFIVPKVLLSGNHKAIDAWRLKKDSRRKK